MMAGGRTDRWVEQLATSLGAPLVDFAWVGATTGIGNYGDGGTPTSFGTYSLPGMQTEFAESKSTIGPYLSSGLRFRLGFGSIRSSCKTLIKGRMCDRH